MAKRQLNGKIIYNYIFLFIYIMEPGDIYEEIASELEPSYDSEIIPFALVHTDDDDLERLSSLDEESIILDESDWYQFIGYDDIDEVPAYFSPMRDFDAEDYTDLIGPLIEESDDFYESPIPDSIDYDDYLDARGLFEDIS